MFAAMFAVALCAISCETDGDLEDYTPPVLSDTEVSEYAPVITALTPGYERLEVSWMLNDVNANYCYIFTESDVVEVNLSDITPDDEGVYSTIVDMEEGDCTVYMKSLDSSNNLTGAGASVSTFVYGEEYMTSSTSHRKVLTSNYYSTGTQYYTMTMSSSYDDIVTGVKVYYIASDDVSAATAAGYSLSMADIDDTYVSYVEFAPEETSYTLPNAYDNMDIIISTEVSPFEDILDPINLLSSKQLSSGATFVEVSSLEALRLYTTRETKNVNVKMTPGVYSFTLADAAAGNFSTSEVYYGTVKPSIICIQGEYNNYDFTGVYIEIADDAGDSTGMGTEFGGMQITGRYNTVRGLNLIDLYETTTTPNNGYTNVTIDGENNVVEDIYVYSAGSTPYGYGEVFGKGSTYTIGHKKHCSLLLRGDYNTIRRCTLLHRAYGHAMFMQGGWYCTIEDCYFESEMVSTDDILAEVGTGSSADLVNFQTCYGYKLPSGYALSTCEDAIRAYTSGTTITWDTRYCDGDEDDVVFLTEDDGVTNFLPDGFVSGKTYYPDGYIASSRGTGPIYAKGTTTKHTRCGSALYLGSGSDSGTTWISGLVSSIQGNANTTGNRFIEDCVSIACQNGFSVRNSGGVKNCKSTTVFAPVVGSTYTDDKYINYEIEVIPYDGDKLVGNGQGQVVLLMGNNHKLYLTASEDYKYDDFTMNTDYYYNSDGKLYIAWGGFKTNHGGLTSSSIPDWSTDNGLSYSYLKNETDFLIVVSAKSSINTIDNYGDEEIIVLGDNNIINNYGDGNVINLGSGNTITQNGDGLTKTSADGYTTDYRRFKSREEEMATNAYN